MKSTTTILLFFLAFTGNCLAQPCNLTEDRTDAYGNVLRSAEWTHTAYSGSYINMLLSRTGKKYTFLLTINQPTSGDAVSFTLDGNVHPVIFNLSNGATVKGWVSKPGVYHSETNGGQVTYSEEYVILESNIKEFEDAGVTALVFRCSGRSVASGNATNEIRFAISATEGETLSNIFRCFQKEDKPKPTTVKIAPTPRKSKPATSSSNDGAQEQLLRTLITVVGEGSKKVKESIEASGSARSEQNDLMIEKLGSLSNAIENLNKKKEKEEFVPRVFGFGVYFKTNYMYSDLIVPVNSDFDLVSARFLAGTSINLTFNAGMKKKVGFRFEPNVDFMMNSATTGSGSSAVRASLTMVEAGLKLLLVIRRGRVNIYPGISGSYLNLAAKQTSGGSNISTVERDGWSEGIILGGEYLVTPNIGIRLESGYLYYGLAKEKNGGTGTEDAFGSFARLGGSFYF